MMELIVLICIIFMVSVNSQNKKQDQMYSSEVEEVLPVKVLHHKAGDEVIMKCRDHDETSNMHEHKWKFFYCDDCDKLKATTFEWKILSQQKKRLNLKSVTISNNGKYICTVNDNIIASYQLRVSRIQNLTQELKFIGRAPKILNIEKNNIRPNGNVAVKCKIVSPLVPCIWWFKQCKEAQKCEVNYEGKFYNKINVTYQDIQEEENVYVSKLHLHNFTHHDDGLYACVTMTTLGKDYRTFMLAMPPPLTDDDERQTSNLSYLFLVPVAFILIPICIDCLGKQIGVKKSKQEVMLLEVIQSSTLRP